MTRYTIEVRDKDGTKLGQFLNWKSLRFDKKLNSYGECSFDVPVTDDALRTLTALRRYQVFVYRDNVIVWAGEQAVRSSSLSAASDNLVTITCYDWLEQLNHRYTGANDRYSATDAGAIAWDLIDTTQGATNGDYGITQGTIETTTPRDRSYQNKNIMEAIIQLSEVEGGFDFEITHGKVFNVYERKGRDLSGAQVFDWASNIEEVRLLTEDFSRPANEAIVLGAGFGSSQLRRVRSDTSSQAVILLRQQRANEVDVSETGTLDAKGDALIAKWKKPILSLVFAQMPNTLPTIGTLELGDTVKVRIKEGIYDIENGMRIFGWNVSIDDRGKESIIWEVALHG